MGVEKVSTPITDLTTHVPPLVRVTAPIQGEGLTYTLRHAIRTPHGIPGYVFDVSEDGDRVGEVCVLITSDREAVGRSGHMGCELTPAYRKRGCVPRIGRGLFPFVRQQGLSEVLITCDVGHQSLRESLLELGAVLLDQLPPAGDDAAKERFLIALP